jgi:hypothetical protein
VKRLTTLGVDIQEAVINYWQLLLSEENKIKSRI